MSVIEDSIDLQILCTIPQTVQNVKTITHQKLLKQGPNRHLLDHSSEKPYTCPTCSQQFRCNRYLKNHMKIHTNERSYNCPTCPKQFRRKDTLNEHIQLHTNEKQYTCLTCSALFKCKRYLKNHMNIHTNTRSYICPTCSKQFGRKDTLNEHMKIHTNCRPHICPTCSRQFRRKDALNEHLRSHTNERPYSCPVCSKQFKYKNCLNAHMKLHTNESEGLLIKNLFGHSGKGYSVTGTMEWTNEKSLEFLELYQTEPVLWDPKLPSHENRSAASNAWRRIIQSLSFPVTCEEELKKKRESLTGYYRFHLNKYKKSLKSAESENDVYKTNWFAFELMDRFLRPIYETYSVIKTKSPATTPEVFLKRSIPGTSTSAKICSESERESLSATKSPNAQYQKSKTPPIDVKRQMVDAFDCLQTIASQKRQLDEYDHFAFLIAAKVRKIQNADDREVLMNSIENLTSEFFMENEQRSTPAESPIKSQAASPEYVEVEIPQVINFPQSDTIQAAQTKPSTSQVANETLQRTISISKSGLIQGLSKDS